MIPVALTIAGSDSGGGAGIQADLKTFAALGVYRDLRDHRHHRAEHARRAPRPPLPPEMVAAQIAAVREDFDVAAVKIGMLASAEIVEAVAAALEPARARVVYDPVMVASSGDALAGAGFAAAAGAACPLDLLTPNLAEAAAMTGAPQARARPRWSSRGGRCWRWARGRC